MTRKRREKGLVKETKLRRKKEGKNVCLEGEVLIQTAREKRRGKRGSGADPGAEPDINTGAGAGVGVDKGEETEVRVMTEEEEDLVLKRRKTGKEIGGLSQGVGQGRGGLGAREGKRKELVKK